MWHDIKLLNATAGALLALTLVAVLGAALWWVAQRPMFTLKSIQVEATAQGTLRHISTSTVRATALPRIKGNFFTVNLDGVRAAFESVPWVRKATVRRAWPNGLVVTVEEHQPLGTWGDDGRLLSVAGDIFTANLAEAEEHGDLPAFIGPLGSEREVVTRYHDFQQWFAVAKLKPEKVSLSGRYAWSVKLSNGMTVELGREQSRDTLKARVERLVNIYPQLLARLQDRIESVDMRYPNGLALRAHGLNLKQEIKKK
ncbi:cell division protein FtsQ/DivIB [Lacisediminimonas sp.]|uniref:cell division protein FtsQ/DivIB n=1 Tax=Lacisediminimonas sp. TaxID=3060582 RepID=UPI00271931CB|nr:cell division protein FtsQ/DivIB [Lacisediminimonas sp.]MDO8299307.1 cell division protein FtsQ/DivIB [Lacisediminimonas sp.]MDO9218711.1 cell division protein FtsQ/DivIB [Lacisediminimonas sp.]